jgi:hypothetical protein
VLAQGAHPPRVKPCTLPCNAPAGSRWVRARARRQLCNKNTTHSAACDPVGPPGNECSMRRDKPTTWAVLTLWQPACATPPCGQSRSTNPWTRPACSRHATGLSG